MQVLAEIDVRQAMAFALQEQHRQPVVTVTSAIDAVEHEVRLDDLAAGVEEGCGRYVGVCGAWFWSAPMSAPPGGKCPACRSVIAAATRPHRRRAGGHPPQRSQRRSHRRRTRLGLLWSGARFRVRRLPMAL